MQNTKEKIIEEKLSNLLDKRYTNFSNGTRASIIKNLVLFVISYGEKEVKRAIHEERSLRASAEYMNKAGKVQK